MVPGIVSGNRPSKYVFGIGYPLILGEEWNNLVVGGSRTLVIHGMGNIMGIHITSGGTWDEVHVYGRTSGGPVSVAFRRWETLVIIAASPDVRTWSILHLFTNIPRFVGLSLWT